MSTPLLRHKLITEATYVIDKYIEMAKDTTAENATLAANARRDIWDAVIPMLQQAGDIKKLEAKNSGDVLKLVSQGKITFAEAKEFMQLFQSQLEIEELPKLLEALEQAE